MSASGPEADYTIVLVSGRSAVLFPDLEASRVEAEERFEELGYEPIPFPWHESRDGEVAALVEGARVLAGEALETALAPARRTLLEPERLRYREAGAAATAAVVQALDRLSPETVEGNVAAELSFQCRRRGFFPPVVLGRRGRAPGRALPRRRGSGLSSWKAEAPGLVLNFGCDDDVASSLYSWRRRRRSRGVVRRRA